MIPALALFLAVGASAQPQNAPAAAPAKSAPARKTSGKSRPSAEEGPDLDAAARRQLACPKGFIAETTGGPHLTVSDKEKKPKKARAVKKGSLDDGESPGPAKRTLSRRCVPVKKTKADKPDDEPRRSAEEVLRE